jgi:hypothetical protein
VRDASERLAYERELIAAAKRLGLPARGDIERSLIRHATETIRTWIAAHGRPKNLSDLLDKVATSFSVEIVEIHSDADIEALLKRIPPTREPVLARLTAELDDSTDAIILQRQNRADWEMPYLAVINCRGWHRSRRYFSKWHEVIHLLLDGKQLRFAFRKRAAKRKHPEEVLVDKIAGELAFHPDLFGPVLLSELEAAGRLTFDVVERVRAEIAPDASRESALYACVRHCPEPVFFLTAKLGYKNSERRQLDDLLSGLDDANPPEAKLRVKSSSPNDAASRSGIRFHENMQVPGASLVSAAYNGPIDRADGQESLEIWQTSDGGPIGRGRLGIEALRRGDEVWCLVRLYSGASGTRTLRAGDQSRYGTAAAKGHIRF